VTGTDGEAHRVERRRRRRRLLALPVALALLVIAFKLVTMSWFSSRGAAAYDEAHYDRSLTEFDRLAVVNVIEPWRAYFGLGTARHRQGDLDGAEAAFRRALELAPQRCDVRFNLVVTIEAQGDRLTGGEQREVEESERLDGLARYRVALDIADAGLCPQSTTGDAGSRLDEARQRLRAKLGAETAGDEEGLEPPVEREDRDRSGEESDSQQQRIADRNQSGAAVREDHSDLDPNQVQEEGTSDW
jgi:tetratricopeptide (TPR) repeat protein